MNPYKWSTLKISSPCLNLVTSSHVRYPLAFFSPSPWRNLHDQRWCHVPCWGPVGQTARPGPHDEMHLCRQWPRRVDLHRVLPAQRYWSSCPSHCVSVILGRVGEISFLFHHWQFKPGFRYQAFLWNRKGMRGAIWSSCLVSMLEKYSFSLCRLASRGKPWLAWSVCIPTSFCLHLAVSATETLQRAQQKPLQSRQNPRLVWSLNAEPSWFIVLLWNFQFLCAGQIPLRANLYEKLAGQHGDYSYLLIYMSGPSGEVLKQYQKKKT